MCAKISEIDLSNINPLNNVEELYKFRMKITDSKVHLKFVNAIRQRVQELAVEAIENGPEKCMVIMATGSGKTKVAIDYAKKNNQKTKNCLFVPTEKLRDENWEEEFKKWGAEEVSKNTEKFCYASSKNVIKNKYGLAILDEGHNITENNSSMFFNNKIEKTVLLTATKPDIKKDFVKHTILNNLGFKVVFEVTLDQAVKLGFVAPYEINIIKIPLEKKAKTVKGGTKKKPFDTTEYAKYKHLSNLVDISKYSPKMSAKFSILNRMRFIYNLPSKLEVAKKFLDSVIPENERILIFSSSIKQAEELCENSFHSKSDPQSYEDFKKGLINRLSCVKSINEGHNFEGLDGALIVQLTSKEKDLIQRLGRLIRVREGHKAKVFILISEDTQDEVWCKKATENLDLENINYYTVEEALNKNFYEN